MNKLFKVTLLLVLAVGSFSGYSAAQATKHVLEGTYNNNGDYNAYVAAATYTPIDTQLIVDCPGTGTCSIQADMWIENGNGDYSHPAANANVICLYVDGQPAGPGFATGETPSDGSGVDTTTSQFVTGLASGLHTVQTYFYSSYGAKVWYYNSNYRVYKP
jgi:hypothetical protein